ncbi:topoisomerase DNA-binding C4 zinc finger domain-containing protein, partial [Candidatus Micrarchaeota archaeon]|nr:topoisomerase DNA-binding C4 zinc finger domain-containing protein [Candidatus Micrarchaeota archaeon]
KIIEKLKENPDYSSLAGKLIEKNRFKPMEGKKEDPAHPAIHPTGQKPKIEGNEKKLYDLIVRRFLACFSEKAVRETDKVTADSNGQIFKAGGSRIIEKGWIEFYGSYYTGKDEIIPEFREGEEVPVEDKKKTNKETKPPRRYTQASVISELEKKHLGTKATRATIVDTLFKRNYVAEKSIKVTEFGLSVDKILKKYAPEILDEDLTRKIEISMEQIQDGKKNKDELIKEGKEILVQILDRWKKNEEKIGNELSGALKITEENESKIGTCDKCGGSLRIIRLRGGKQFIGCSGYPKCKNAFPLPTGAYVKPTGKQCKECGMPVVMISRKRKRYSACVNPKCPSKEKWKKRSENK